MSVVALLGAMLHWAKSFAAIAALSSVVGLWIHPSPFVAVTVFLTAVFVTLAILALLTGALGKRRDGWSYSVTQAMTYVAVMVGAVWVVWKAIGGGV